jgi:NAD-dependent dihydropyrimidine dehydrogenase PreA subunit
MVSVLIDYDKCNGDNICVDVCPVAVFELQKVMGHERKKPVVVSNDACIICDPARSSAPTQAITVAEQTNIDVRVAGTLVLRSLMQVQHPPTV